MEVQRYELRVQRYDYLLVIEYDDNDYTYEDNHTSSLITLASNLKTNVLKLAYLMNLLYFCTTFLYV